MSREQCAFKKIMVKNSLHAVKAKPSTERKRWSRPWQLVSGRSWTDFNGNLPSCSRQNRCCCSFKPQLNVKVSYFLRTILKNVLHVPKSQDVIPRLLPGTFLLSVRGTSPVFYANLCSEHFLGLKLKDAFFLQGSGYDSLRQKGCEKRPKPEADRTVAKPNKHAQI